MLVSNPTVLTRLQRKDGSALTRDEWMSLALAGQLTQSHLQWRSELAALDNALEHPHDLMLQAADEGYSPGSVLLGALLQRQQLHAPRFKLPSFPAGAPTVLKVSKFNPGQHYHVLDVKFG